MSHHKASERKTSNKLTSVGYPSEDAKWRAESDLRTLTHAQEIQKDKMRLRAAKVCAKEQMKSLSKVTSGARKK
jgi:hypothetical protein